LSGSAELASHETRNNSKEGVDGGATAMEERMADEAVIAQKGPYQVELTEGKPYFYCRCGRSQKQPFCDGSHKDTGIEPMRFVVDHTGTFNICGCKTTDDEPFCDGSHLLL
jgi:CDGSH-type Zn-finger protein